MNQKLRIVTAFILALEGLANAQVTKEEQSALTPDKVLADLMEGNGRFVAGKIGDLEIKKRIANSAEGQYPKAVVLSCVDSRVPVELVFDQRIGDIFVGRVAGNIEDEDQIGSMEFATKLAGAKLVFVLGHSACGAVKGACDGAKLGNLTALLAKIRPAVDAVQGFKPEERTSKNNEFVEKVVEQNVRQTMADIRKDSPILAELESSGKIKIVGGIYDLHTGKITLLK
ncbi:MAG TPA: carbonic anhydrase family protein [Chthoniobacterales bacterium]|nr:carbonic anhydrase family protein [Chthoniobacterales bacterium]